MHNVPKWYLKTLQEMLQDFENVFSDFGTLSTNGLNLICPFIKQAEFFPEAHSKVSQASKMELFLSVYLRCSSGSSIRLCFQPNFILTGKNNIENLELDHINSLTFIYMLSAR